MIYREQFIATSAARTASATSTAVDTLGGENVAGGDVRFFISCTAVSGTNPTLDVDIVAEINGVDVILDSLTQLTAAGQETVAIAACPRLVKIDYTIGGTDTPTFTFSVGCNRT